MHTIDDFIFYRPAFLNGRLKFSKVMIGILNIFWFFTVKLTMHTLHTGRDGPAGEDGVPGRSGEPGPPGPAAIQGINFITRHSQTTIVPDCPFGMRKMWDGYSFLFMQGNERPHGQDLGKDE